MDRIEQAPYHFMETVLRITTAATIEPREGDLLTDLLSISEDIGGAARHATNELSIWLGDLGEPSSVVTVCDRLIAALGVIRDRNARLAEVPSDTPLALEDDAAGEGVEA